MTNINCYTAFFLIMYSFLSAQTFDLNLSIVNNYNEWGWDSVFVVENGLIKTAIIPIIGARTLEYNLSDHPCMFVNPARLGFVSEDGDPYAFPGGGIGGYKVWPAPQADWEGSEWPPPPILAWGPYTHNVLSNNADSVSLFFSSLEETSRAPEIRFERQYTFYKNSSRVKVEQIIINASASSKNWGIWDNTQCIVNHQGESDYENFWVYFPKNPDSHYGEVGYRFRSYDNPTDGWHGEVVPGIIGAHHEPANVKLFGDPQPGWICYVDEREGYAYAKTFDLYEDATYPDDEASVAIYFNGSPKYMEVEVMGPVVELAPNGDNYSFTINWWTAKVNGPILNVNHIGAIARYAVQEDSLIKGTYGVFHFGTAQPVFLSESGEVIKNGQEYSISPLETFNLSDTTSIPHGTAKMELRVLNPDHELIGVLDSMTFIIDGIEDQVLSVAGQFELHQNYPNPFNPTTKIQYSIPKAENVNLKVYDILGREVLTLVNEEKSAGKYEVDFNASNLSSGVYFYKIQAGSFNQTKKLILIK